MTATQTINVWEVKKMQDKLSDVVSLMFAAGLESEAREMLRVFDTVINKAAE
jgi:hypothetical protein